MPATGVPFSVDTPLGFRVRVSVERWRLVVELKHPVMAGREAIVRRALEAPDEVRCSRSDSRVVLFYRSDGERRWVCAVARQTDADAFLITAYPTDAIKEGVRIWPT